MIDGLIQLAEYTGIFLNFASLLFIFVFIASIFWVVFAKADGIEEAAKLPLEEKDLLRAHSYDGIHELDNALPPWWKGLFYVTIAFGFVYILLTHILNVIHLADESYALQVAAVENAQKENSMSGENTTIRLRDDQSLEKGKSIFKQHCIACHGANGEGGIGPNMTDAYWLHGASMAEVTKIINEGVPAKGMISWNRTLRPKQIQEVASFLFSLQGSNPPNPKAPQGDKVEPELIGR